MSFEFSITLQNGAFLLNAQGKLPDATTIALIGRSGSGKTTLLRSLAGLESTAEGDIRFNNQIWQSSTQPPLPTEQRKIGYVFQRGALFPHLSVSQNIEYAIKRAKGEPLCSYDQIINATRIAPLLKQNPDTLSGGETQRVALARALCSNPQLLLLDEPFSALDWEGRADLLDALEETLGTIRIPTIIVTHNLADAARLASHALKLENGKVVANGQASEILPTSYELAEDRREPFSVSEASMASYDTKNNLTHLDSPIGTLLTPTRHSSTDTKFKVTIWARDVSLALIEPEGTSLLNILPAKVENLTPFDESRTLVTLTVGTATLRSLITKKSATDLNLTQNLPCYCLIKSVSILA